MIRAASRAIAALVLGVACAAPGTVPPNTVPFGATQASPLRVYVPNQNDATVTIVDPGGGEVLATVNLRDAGFTANAKPHAVIAEPDGSAWYVTLIGDGWVAKFNRENRLVGRARMETPGMLALDPAHDRVYASRSMTAVSAPSSVGVIRRSDMTLLEELDVILPRPHAIAVDTSSGLVYVSGLGDNRIAVIDTSGRVELTDVPGPLHAYVTFALSPDGSRLAATTQLTSSLLAFDVSGALPTLSATVPVLPFGYQVAWTPDGRSIWIGNQRSGAVTEVDAGAWTVAGVIRDSAFAEPHGVAVSPDGRTVYVSSHGIQTAPSAPTPADTMHGGMHAGEAAPRDGGTLALIDERTRAIREIVRVGHYAVALGVGGGSGAP